MAGLRQMTSRSRRQKAVTENIFKKIWKDLRVNLRVGAMTSIHRGRGGGSQPASRYLLAQRRVSNFLVF